MKTRFINSIDVIPMTKYEYNKNKNKVAHIEQKREHGFYLAPIHIWLPDILFNKYFELLDED